MVGAASKIADVRVQISTCRSPTIDYVSTVKATRLERTYCRRALTSFASFRFGAEPNRVGLKKFERLDHVLRICLVFEEMRRFQMRLVCSSVGVCLENSDLVGILP